MTERATRAIIVEDEPLLRQSLREQLAELWPELQIINEAGNGLEAVKMLSANMPDVLFLDIQMPGMNGLEVAKLISGRCHVVFVTAFDQYAVAAFEQDAVDFLVKPLERERLITTVNRLQQRLNQAPKNLDELLRAIGKKQVAERIRWIQANVGTKIRVVPVEEVIYFQSDSKYTKVVTNRGELHIRKTIKDLAEGLDEELFWRIHRGTIVNAKLIDSIARHGEQMELRLLGVSDKLSVSQPYQYRFRSQ